MKRLGLPFVRFFLLLSLMLTAVATAAMAEGLGVLKVEVASDVIYCSASIRNGEAAFSHALKDGIPVTTVWNLKVGQVREYWLDKGVADIRVSRKVMPDLLSKSWLLVDEASGISRRTHSMAEAIEFLSSLDRFPLLDRPLLMPGLVYLAHAAVELHSGDIKEAWWSDLWHSVYAEMSQEFALP